MGAIVLLAPRAAHSATAGPGLPADFIALNLHAAGFNLRAWLRPGSGEMLHVFIEGDGSIWRDFNRPAFNPTPRNPVSARLAADTPLPAPVLYVARPGQYVSDAELRRLSARWWTSHRYAPPVVEAMCGVIEQGLQRSQTSSLGLYGHSGGGALAVLAAANLRENLSLVATVASPLDTAAWAELHRGSLADSMNPTTVARQLRDCPQFHLSGTRDEIVPTRILDSWLAELQPLPEWVKRVVVAGADHQGPWVKSWRLALARALAKALGRLNFSERRDA